MIGSRLRAGSALAALIAAPVHAQTAEPGQIVVSGQHGYGTLADSAPPPVDLGPLGKAPVLDTPASVTTVTESVIVNNQARTVNDTLRYLPSVEVRDQQGLEVSRPQSRGFQSSIVQDTRLDGLNVVGTTAIAAENLQGVQVLNGMAGALYGPQSPAGVFDYQLKRPTDQSLTRVIGSFDALGMWTGALDASRNLGPVSIRLNALHGAGESWVDQSHASRTLVAADVDVHIDSRTVLELDGSYYHTQAYGLPGSIVYFNPQTILLPPAPDAKTVGLGQPGAGTDLKTETYMAKLRHDLGGGWSLVFGALYQNADRGLYGITNTLTDNAGDYTVTKNFTAVPRFNVFSNMLSINGSVTLWGMKNDLSIATNGFVNGQFSNVKSIAVTLGKSNLSDPAILPTKPTPATGGQYKSGSLAMQSIVTGDTVHVTDQFAVQAVMSTSFLTSSSFGATGTETSHNNEAGVVSPTVSLVYKPVPNLTLYTTFADSVEQGETAPSGTVNVNQILNPYRDYQYEAGAKFAPVPGFLITSAVFRMTRPLAQTDPTTNVFEVVGTQRNWGAELFGQGNVTPALSVLGGLTWIDARLENAILPNTNDRRVVGVPGVKSDVTADYHPAFAQGFALTGAVHYESNRAATNIGNSYAPAYATFDLGARYNAHWFGHNEVARVNVINVGDKSYYSSIADGSIVGSPGANTAYLGQPRTVMASLEFDL
jgi:iron complex outermembrane recepter protein